MSENLMRDFKGIWIPKEIWLSKELNITEKVFIVEIDSLNNEDGCFASNEYFSNFFSLSKNRCSEIIKGLEKKGYITISYKYKDNTKCIEKRIIKTTSKMYGRDSERGTRDSERGTRDSERGTRDSERGYSENTEDNNINNNNINNNIYNNTYIEKPVDKCVNEKLSSMSKLYQKNIGVANGIVGEWLIEVSEQIDVDLFRRAVEICTEKGNCNLGYLKGIIKKWLDVNITTLEQLKAYELQNRKQPTNSILKQQQFIPHFKVPGENRVGVRVHETFRDYDPDELERMLLESQKGKFD